MRWAKPNVVFFGIFHGSCMNWRRVGSERFQKLAGQVGSGQTLLCRFFPAGAKKKLRRILGDPV